MQTRMTMVVQKGDADSAGASGCVEHTGQDRKPLLVTRLLVSWNLGRQYPLMPGKVHGDDGPGEGEGSNDTAGYKQRLQAEGTDIRDECNGGIGLSGISRAALR